MPLGGRVGALERQTNEEVDPMRSRLFLPVFGLVAGLLCLACGAPAADSERQSAAAQSGTCPLTNPTATGAFVASGNESPDPFGEVKNPIISVTASGHTLTFTSKNGETGTITLSEATAAGQFQDAWGLAQVWLAPFDGPGPSRPTSTMRLSGGAGENFSIVLTGAEASALGGGFGFANPFEGSPPYAVAVRASGNTISISDPWGHAGTITLSGVPNCSE
jgi:hypothetical protein